MSRTVSRFLRAVFGVEPEPARMRPVVRAGRTSCPAAGYSALELERAGIPLECAERMGLPIDRARRSAIGTNIVELEGWRGRYLLGRLISRAG